MKSLNMRKILQSPWIYLAIWLIVNILQATYTELWHDEANYWMFSRHLDWGFFDHPPATAMMIHAGEMIFPGEFGVRVFFVVSSVLTLLIIWKLSDVKDNPLFFSLIFSSIILHLGGWFAAPDIPLLLFTALFFLLLKKYIEKDSWWTALLLSLSLAMIAYSKYHGAVPVVAAFLANLSLMRRLSFWVIPVLTIAFFAPHLYWQYLHDFPTFRYHLIDRQQEVYQWTSVTDYLLGQLLVFGPFMSFILFGAAFSFKPTDQFGKTLRWSMIAVLGFFFLQSFRGRTEANWTATAFIPMVYLSYRYISGRPKLIRWVYRLLIPSLLIMIVFRVYQVYDFLPGGLNPRNECHGYREWAADISEKAGDLPVIFYNNYQRACKYMFYSGKFAHVVNIATHSGSQFDLNTADEASIQGKKVFSIFLPQDTAKGTSFIAGKKIIRQTVSYEVIDSFWSFNRVKIAILNDIPDRVAVGTDLPLKIRMINPTQSPVLFPVSGNNQVSLHVLICEYDRIVSEMSLVEPFPLKTLEPGGSHTILAHVKMPDKPGKYRYRVGIHVRNRFTGRNMTFRNIEVYD